MLLSSCYDLSGGYEGKIMEISHDSLNKIQNLEAPKYDFNRCCTIAGAVECIMCNVTTSY